MSKTSQLSRVIFLGWPKYNMMTKGGGEVWVHPKNEEVQINLSLLIAWTVDICSTALGALRSLAVSAPEISCAISKTQYALASQ